MDKKKFFNLADTGICSIIRQKQFPRTGIFLSDGNRRLVMTQTGLKPGQSSFWQAYLETVTRCFKENLAVFFNHGLENLFFPIFGESLLERGPAYIDMVLPTLLQYLFVEPSWLDFYRQSGIRVRCYGNLKKLETLFPGQNFLAMLQEVERATGDHKPFTLYYGFFSSPYAVIELREKLEEYFQHTHQEPTREELIKMYYGESIPPADFFINSMRIGGLGALPPLLTGRETQIYTLPGPAVMGLNTDTFRKILYDLLYTRPKPPRDRKANLNCIESNEIVQLQTYFQQNKNRVLGIGKKINGSWVLDI